jgi:hypothetical protein
MQIRRGKERKRENGRMEKGGESEKRRKRVLFMR